MKNEEKEMVKAINKKLKEVKEFEETFELIKTKINYQIEQCDNEEKKQSLVYSLHNLQITRLLVLTGII